MYQRNGVFYSDFFYGGKRYRQTLHTSNEQEAISRENMLRAYMQDARVTTKEFVYWRDLKAWYWRYVLRERSKSTQYIVQRALSLFETYRTPYYARHITPDWVAGFKAFLQEEFAGRQCAARNRYVKAIKAMMRKAEEYGKIGIMQSWRLVSRDRSELDNRTEYHSETELQEIRRVLTGDLLTVFYLGWACGLRRGEMAYLYKTDYNPSQHTITISPKKEWRPKTQRSARTIPIPPEIEPIIWASIKAAPADSPYLINLEGNRNYNGYISATYRRICRRELPYLHCYLHKLRHTYGSMLVQRGVNIKTVCDLMGHRNILQTEKYLHMGFSQYTQAVGCLPKI